VVLYLEPYKHPAKTKEGMSGTTSSIICYVHNAYLYNARKLVLESIGDFVLAEVIYSDLHHLF
jgi:hypothetical protein